MNENLISPILLLDQLHQLDIVLDLFAKHETVRVVEHESVQTVVFAQEWVHLGMEVGCASEDRIDLQEKNYNILELLNFKPHEPCNEATFRY